MLRVNHNRQRWIFVRTDMEKNATGLKPFEMRVSEDRQIKIDGPPVRELPRWGGTAVCDGVVAILHPPIDFEISYEVDSYVFVLPFSLMNVDMAIGDGPLCRYQLRSGSGMLVPPCTTVRARTAAPVELLVVEVERTRGEEFIADAACDHSWSPRVLFDILDPGVRAIACEIRRTLLGDPLVEPGYLVALARVLMARFTYRCIESDPQSRFVGGLAPIMLRKVTGAIDHELATDIRVEDLADRFNLSRAHFSRAFRETTGQSPKEFIVTRRINRARELLTETTQGIAEIAVATGFSSQAHFSTAFKKRVGVSPARYRNAFGDD